MRRHIERLIGLMAAIALIAAACSSKRSIGSGDDASVADATADNSAADQGQIDAAPDRGVDQRTDAPVTPPPTCQPCTDPVTCCKPEETVCYGDPDEGVICTCPYLWDCSADGCEQRMPQPAETGDWTCKWTKAVYTCSEPGSGSAPPDASADWSCSFDAATSSWVCTAQPPPNPCNDPDGLAAWSCQVDNAEQRLICTGGETPPPCSIGSWSCTQDGQVEVCQRTDQAGLPTTSGNWSCHQAVVQGKLSWDCRGTSPTPPSPGGSWSCEAAGTGDNAYRCTADVYLCEVPPGDAQWQCIKGSAFGGTRCERLPETGECFPGQQRWCDGLDYGGWGLVNCLPDGTWATATVNGKQVLDCAEPSSGAVPATQCACYHYFVNPSCCERADCVLPASSAGQSCGPSPGGQCDYCDPQNPECAGQGTICVVSNTMETFCAEACTASSGCAPGLICVTVKISGDTSDVCVPTDYSCYF